MRTLSNVKSLDIRAVYQIPYLPKVNPLSWFTLWADMWRVRRSFILFWIDRRLQGYRTVGGHQHRRLRQWWVDQVDRSSKESKIFRMEEWAKRVRSLLWERVWWRFQQFLSGRGRKADTLDHLIMVFQDFEGCDTYLPVPIDLSSIKDVKDHRPQLPSRWTTRKNQFPGPWSLSCQKSKLWDDRFYH